MGYQAILCPVSDRIINRIKGFYYISQSSVVTSAYYWIGRKIQFQGVSAQWFCTDYPYRVVFFDWSLDKTYKTDQSPTFAFDQCEPSIRFSKGLWPNRVWLIPDWDTTSGISQINWVVNLLTCLSVCLSVCLLSVCVSHSSCVFLGRTAFL